MCLEIKNEALFIVAMNFNNWKTIIFFSFLEMSKRYKILKLAHKRCEKYSPKDLCKHGNVAIPTVCSALFP